MDNVDFTGALLHWLWVFLNVLLVFECTRLLWLRKSSLASNALLLLGLITLLSEGYFSFARLDISDSLRTDVAAMSVIEQKIAVNCTDDRRFGANYLFRNTGRLSDYCLSDGSLGRFVPDQEDLDALVRKIEMQSKLDRLMKWSFSMGWFCLLGAFSGLAGGSLVGILQRNKKLPC